jgi:chromosome segregation ATPase
MNRKFEVRKNAFDELKRVGDERANLKGRLDQAWNDVQWMRERMNSEYQRRQETWDAYKRHRESLSYEIDQISARADYAHAKMKEAFENASYCYKQGDKSSAPRYASDGRDWKDERDRLNQEKANLINKIKWLLRPEEGNFTHYKAEFDMARGRHQNIQSQYRRVKEVYEAVRKRCDTAKSEFEAAKARFDSARSEEAAKWKTTYCEDCGAEIRYHIEWAHVPKRCKSCKEKHQDAINRLREKTAESKWQLQSKNPDAIVNVSSSYSRSRPDLLRTDFIVIDRKNKVKKHFSVGEDTSWELREWHDWE